MKIIFRRSLKIFCLAFALAAPAFPDLNLTVTLQANSTLNLETGATGGPGADLLWNGTTITPQGNATASHIGDIPYNTVTLAILTFLPGYSRTPIAANDLRANNVFAVRTNLNRLAKVLVQANSGGSIRLQFTTYGAPASAAGGPTITAIQNNSSRIPRGLPNYGIAPSSLFVVVGNGLADAGEPVLQSSQGSGIPLTLNGASITVVVNGVTTRPGLWYTSPGQIAAVLPAATPIGAGTLTVTYRGVTSAPAAIQVVPSAVGINSYNGNLGVATDALTGALLTVTNPGSPGQNIVLWTTGLGADPADSDTIFSTSPHSVDTPLQIYIGGIRAAILYQGSAGYPGVNQINVTIPDAVTASCFVPVAAVTGNVLSNIVTLPIAHGGGACIDTLTGLNGQQVAAANVRTGLVSLVQTNSPNNSGAIVVSNSANAAFGRYAGLAQAATGAVAAPGGCVAFPIFVGGPVTFTGLDAGVITLSGPSGPDVTLRSQLGIRGAYNALLAAGAIPSSGGTFTFRGAGGADVGSFTTSIELSGPLMNWTNRSVAATIDKSQGLTVTWTGGNPGTFISISGTAVPANSGGAGPAAGFTCLAPAADGEFTVPAYILLALPSGPGGMEVQNIIYSQFPASGIDIGLALATISHSATSSTYR
jgi:uncharacterized protein (TIGR03437 family)